MPVHAKFQFSRNNKPFLAISPIFRTSLGNIRNSLCMQQTKKTAKKQPSLKKELFLTVNIACILFTLLRFWGKVSFKKMSSKRRGREREEGPHQCAYKKGARLSPDFLSLVVIVCTQSTTQTSKNSHMGLSLIHI